MTSAVVLPAPLREDFRAALVALTKEDRERVAAYLRRRSVDFESEPGKAGVAQAFRAFLEQVDEELARE